MPNRIDAPSSGTMIWYALYVVSRPYYQPLSAYQADMGILYCCLEKEGRWYLLSICAGWIWEACCGRFEIGKIMLPDVLYNHGHNGDITKFHYP